MAGLNNPDLDTVMEELRKSFYDTARQKLTDLEAQITTLSAMGREDSEVEANMRREIHSLKGMGGTFGFPAITSVSHRLEDFVANVGGFSKRSDDVLVFIDCLSDILDMEPHPDNAAIAKIVRDLPAGTAKSSVDTPARKIEVLLVVPNQVLRPLLQHHLERNGCRVVGADSPFEALELSVRTLPELVISSVVLTGLDGIDLLRSLSAMTSTASINLAALTSWSRDDPLLADLPQKAGVISTDETLETDLLTVLRNLPAPA